jgi:NADPH-dependent ferric siderophore reductase
LPEPAPAGYVIVGDAASLPAINSLLDAIGDTPATIFLEAVAAAAFGAADHFGWVACDNRTTRAVAKICREECRIPRRSITAQAYWAS